MEHFEQGLKIALENNLIMTARIIYNSLCLDYWARGEYQKHSETCRKALETARTAGDMYSMGWTKCRLAICQMGIGEMQEALALCEEALAMGKKIKHSRLLTYAMVAFGYYYCFRGEFNTASQCLKEGYELARKAEDYQFLGYAAHALGWVLVESGDYAGGEEYLKESSSIFENAGDMDVQHILVLPDLAAECLMRGEVNEAEKLIEKCCEYADRTGNRKSIALAERLKGMFFRQQKNWEQSLQHFERSLQEQKSLGVDKWWVYGFALLLYEYGLVYLERNKEGDRERAYSLLDRAMAIFEKLGLRQRIERIIAKKKLLTA